MRKLIVLLLVSFSVGAQYCPPTRDKKEQVYAKNDVKRTNKEVWENYKKSLRSVKLNKKVVRL